MDPQPAAQQLPDTHTEEKSEDEKAAPLVLGNVSKIDPAREEEVRRQLTESRAARKKAEEDRRLLTNRLQLLKMEEQKALKKIESTRQKAKEIAAIKTRNATKQKEREEAKKRLAEKRAQLNSAYKEMKLGIKQGIAVNRKQVLEQKQQTSKSIKDEREVLRAFQKRL